MGVRDKDFSAGSPADLTVELICEVGLFSLLCTDACYKQSQLFLCNVTLEGEVRFPQAEHAV